MKKKSYSIIWKHFDNNSDTGKHLNAKEQFSLPYFIDGIDKENFENQKSTNLNVLHLIKGLLVGYFDQPPGTETNFAKSKTKEILTEHLETFQAESLESLILDFAAHLREQNSEEASLQALMTGVEIMPTSNSIKYDCCVDLYSCLEDSLIKDRDKGVQRLDQLLDEIDTKSINPELKKGVQMMKEDVASWNR